MFDYCLTTLELPLNELGLDGSGSELSTSKSSRLAEDEDTSDISSDTPIPWSERI